MSDNIGEGGVDIETEGRWQWRRGAFFVVVLATLALALVMMYNELLLAFTGWFEDLGIHQVHDLTIFGMLWLAYVVPVALLLYRPERRVNAVLAPLVFLAPLVVFAGLISSPILMLPALFGALAVVILALHPAGRDLFRVDRVGRVNRYLAGLVVVAAVPLLVYAGDQTVRQLTAGDEHAMFAHFGAMAIGAVYIALFGTLAVLRERDWRFATWSAGAVAALIGVASVTFDVASSIGPVWGALAVAWALAFVAGTEYVRRDQTLDVTLETESGGEPA